MVCTASARRRRYLPKRPDTCRASLPHTVSFLLTPVRLGRAKLRRHHMGIFDKAKALVSKADDITDKAKDVVADHGDKLPGGLGDKAKDALDQVDAITDKIPGQG
jgi:hypothetical protein